MCDKTGERSETDCNACAPITDKSDYSAESDIPAIEFEICIEILPKYTTQEVKAAMYKRNNIPDDEVISELRSAIITNKIEVDYASFIESLEDLLTEYYGLELVYEDEYQDYSYYYSFIAKEKESGKLFFKFTLRLRISNHSAYRSDASQAHKTEDIQTARYKELIRDISNGSRSYTQNIVVNTETYRSYEAAFVDIDDQVDRFMKKQKPTEQIAASAKQVNPIINGVCYVNDVDAFDFDDFDDDIDYHFDSYESYKAWMERYLET